jgi:hypothetical protein
MVTAIKCDTINAILNGRTSFLWASLATTSTALYAASGISYSFPYSKRGLIRLSGEIKLTRLYTFHASPMSVKSSHPCNSESCSDTTLLMPIRLFAPTSTVADATRNESAENGQHLVSPH